MMDGPINGDELFDAPIVEVTEEQKEIATEKISEGEDLFPVDPPAVKKPRSSKASIEVSQEILDEVEDAIGGFDAESANKKQIRSLRKALQNLSLAKYPKKAKKKKVK